MSPAASTSSSAIRPPVNPPAGGDPARRAERRLDRLSAARRARVGPGDHGRRRRGDRHGVIRRVRRDDRSDRRRIGFGFTGETSDAAGIYLRARAYDPATGLFLSTRSGPARRPGVVGYNPYTYVGNNPTTWTDPNRQRALVEAAIQYGREHPVVVAAAALALWETWGSASTRCNFACAHPVRWPRRSPSPRRRSAIWIASSSLDDVINGIKKFAKTITDEIAKTILAACGLAAAGVPGGPGVCSGRVFVTGGMFTSRGNQSRL